MTITVNTPDGGTAQFPDDTPQDAIVGAMKAKFGGPDANAMPDAERNPLGVISKVGNTIADTATFGLGDTIAGLLGGKTQEMRKDTAQDRSDIGALSIPADVIGYGMGGGALGLGEKAAAGLAARGVGPRLAQAGGSAFEAGAASAAGDIGHGETPGWDVAGNATVGGALGGLIGSRKIGGVKPPAPRSLDDLQAAKDAAYRTLESTPVNPGQVKQTVGDAIASLKPGQEAGLSRAMRGQIDHVNNIIDKSPKLSLGDVDNFAKSFGEIANSKLTDTDPVAAAKVGEALRALGGQPGADARMAQARLSDAKWLTGADPSKVAGEAATKLGNPRMLYDPTGRMAMTDLANSGPSKFTEMAQNLGARGINAGLTAAAGGGLGALAGHGLLGAGIGALEGRSPGGIGGMLMRQYNSQRAKQAMKAALASVSQPGVYVSPNAYRMSPWTRTAARQAVYGHAASGQ